MDLNIFGTMPIYELEKYAYALQIPYRPPLKESDRAYILDRILWIKQNADKFTGEAIRKVRAEERNGKICHNPKTFIGNKDILLLSIEQLVFMPELDDSGKILRYECFDRFEDLNYLLTHPENPFTQKKLTREQIDFLESQKISLYPNIYVDELPEEIQNRLLKPQGEYESPQYLKLARTLMVMIENVGLKYEAEQVLNFATNLSDIEYNLFLSHKPINQVIDVKDKSRNDIALETLNYIISYIEERESIDDGKIYLGKAIDEFMYMKNNGLNYNELLEERGIFYENSNVRELYWKPKFIEETLHKNGEIKYQYHTNEKDELHGFFIYYDKNGVFKQTGQTENGNRIGIWKQFNIDNTFEEIDMNIEMYRRWYANGILKSEGTILNGKKSGLWRKWYHNGQLKLKGNWINNEQLGDWCTWYDNGQLKSEENLIDGIGSGIWHTWHKNGQLQSEGNTINGKDSGIMNTWYENGQLASQSNMINGDRVGICRKWHENGQLASQGLMIKGHKMGTWSSWYANGQLRSEGKKDKYGAIGLWRTWHENGKLKSQGNMSHNSKEGLWHTWYNDGQLEMEENYIRFGDRLGPWYVWHRNGKLRESGIGGKDTYLHQKWYDNGQLEIKGHVINNQRSGIWCTWHRNGQLESKGNMVKHLKSGWWHTWHDNGQLKSEENYINGKEDGPWSEWYSNGQLKLMGNYINDEKSGLWREWLPEGRLISAGYRFNNQKIGSWSELNWRKNLIEERNYN